MVLMIVKNSNLLIIIPLNMNMIAEMNAAILITFQCFINIYIKTGQEYVQDYKPS